MYTMFLNLCLDITGCFAHKPIIITLLYILGSIVVYFELYTSSGSDTLGQMAYTLESMFTSGSMTFTSHTGAPLNVQTGSFSYAQKTSKPDDKDEKGLTSVVFVLKPFNRLSRYIVLQVPNGICSSNVTRTTTTVSNIASNS